MVPDRLWSIQNVSLGDVRSHLPALPAARQSIIYKCGELRAGGNSICLCLTGVLLWPPKRPPLDIMRTLSWCVSYRRLSPQFQFSLSAAALGIYHYGSTPPIRIVLLVSHNSTHQTRVISLQNKWQNRSRGHLRTHSLSSSPLLSTEFHNVLGRDSNKRSALQQTGALATNIRLVQTYLRVTTLRNASPHVCTL